MPKGVNNTMTRDSIHEQSYIVNTHDYTEAERLSPDAAARVRVPRGYRCFQSVDSFKEWQYNDMDKELGHE